MTAVANDTLTLTPGVVVARQQIMFPYPPGRTSADYARSGITVTVGSTVYYDRDGSFDVSFEKVGVLLTWLSSTGGADGVSWSLSLQLSAPPGGTLTAQSFSPMPRSQETGLYNFNATNLRNWQEALAARQAGTRNAKLAFGGDSTIWGSGSVAGATVRSPENAVPGALARQWAALSVPASWQSFFGTGKTTNELPYDTRLSFTGDWTWDGNRSVGGRVLVSASSGTASFAVATDCDTFDLWFLKGATAGTVTINLDGGSTLATVNLAGSAAMVKQTVTGTLGAHTVNVVHSAGGSVRWHSCHAYNSAAKEISVWNWGISGLEAAEGADVTLSYSYGNALTYFASDLFVLGCTVNDSNNGTSIDSYKTSLTSIAALQRAGGGDIIFMSGPPSNIANYSSLSRQREIVEAMKAVAYEVNAPFIDLHARWGSYEISNPSGFYADDVHTSFTGNCDWAAYLRQALLV